MANSQRMSPRPETGRRKDKREGDGRSMVGVCPIGKFYGGHNHLVRGRTLSINFQYQDPGTNR